MLRPHLTPSQQEVLPDDEDQETTVPEATDPPSGASDESEESQTSKHHDGSGKRLRFQRPPVGRYDVPGATDVRTF